ncbi:hypothetical protein H8B01_02910 [Bradyrhizobium sp. Cham227]|nr:hypothetical protein [Bradyrhizobium brasilense]
MMWMPIETAPFDRDLELAVIEAKGDIYSLIFLCRRDHNGWIKTATGRAVEVHPTHWRNWGEQQGRSA